MKQECLSAAELHSETILKGANFKVSGFCFLIVLELFDQTLSLLHYEND